MYHRHSASSSSMTHIAQPGQFQRTRSVATSAPSMFQESNDTAGGTTSSSQHNLSFSALDDSFMIDNDDNKYHKSSFAYQTTKQTLYWRILPCFVLLVLPWIPNQRTHWQIQSRKSTINSLIRDQKEMVSNLDESTNKIKELQKEIDVLTKDNELSFQEIHRNGRGKELTMDKMEDEQYAELEKEESDLVKRIDKLEKAIQRRAQKRLDERYGSGNHRLKVTVRDEFGSRSFFIIETAMTMEMPHAIDHFFRMVEKKLWDGLTLVHEPNTRIIMATPTSMDDSHTWAGKRFKDSNLTHMAFNEYSPTFPAPHHRKFSVAFSGRPGGPNFYINLDDELEFAHEHESTFGVVMEGRDILYKLYLQKQNDSTAKKMLTIESIVILKQKNEEDVVQS